MDPNILILSEHVEALEAENKLLRKELRVVSMQSLSDLGQAQDAYTAQLAAEEKLKKIVRKLQDIYDWVEDVGMYADVNYVPVAVFADLPSLLLELKGDTSDRTFT
jgi:transketolase